MAPSQLVDRQPLPITVPADLLEQLHSRSHPFRGLLLTLDRAPKVDSRSDGGGAKSGVRTGAKSGVRAQYFRVQPEWRPELEPADPTAGFTLGDLVRFALSD